MTGIQLRKLSTTFNLDLQEQPKNVILWLTPEKVEMCLSGVKGNFYAPFFGEGERATAFSYPTWKGRRKQFLLPIRLMDAIDRHPAGSIDQYHWFEEKQWFDPARYLCSVRRDVCIQTRESPLCLMFEVGAGFYQ